MDMGDTIALYGLAISVIVVLVTAITWLISTKISPLFQEIGSLKEKLADLEKDQKEIQKEIDELKQALVEEVKDISKGNYEFRLKYEKAISQLELDLVSKYVSKSDLEKEMANLKEKVDAHQLKSIREIIKMKNKD